MQAHICPIHRECGGHVGVDGVGAGEAGPEALAAVCALGEGRAPVCVSVFCEERAHERGTPAIAMLRKKKGNCIQRGRRVVPRRIAAGELALPVEATGWRVVVSFNSWRAGPEGDDIGLSGCFGLG